MNDMIYSITPGKIYLTKNPYWAICNGKYQRVTITNNIVLVVRTDYHVVTSPQEPVSFTVTFICDDKIMFFPHATYAHWADKFTEVCL